MGTQLEDTKRLGDAEARDIASLLTKYKNLMTEAENLRMRIDEENEKKNDALKGLSKAQAEIQLWKSKYEVEALGRIDELEGGKAKLASRVQEAEEHIENLNTKIASAEKSKSRMDNELEELSMEYERTHAAAMITEKRGRNFDKVVGEWKAKADDLMAELDACSSECRNFNAERFRIKAALDESGEQLDIVRRENKNLADEVKDLLDQLGDGGRSIHELDKQRRRLEVEKEELQAALEEAEAALEQEENKVLRASLELGQVRQEIDRKIAEKVEEFDNTRKNHARAMDSLQASLDGEARAKADSDKRRLESAVHTIHAEIDETLAQAKASEEKAKRAMVDAARLADELRAEQDHSSAQGKAKRALETQIAEVELRLGEANEVAAKGGRNAMAKLEARIRELEIELGSIQAKTGETYKTFQKAERHVKELQFQGDEDRKNQDRMSELASKLQQKIKTYKKQIEEAEEIAALNLAKFRKAQQDLEANEDRAKSAGAALLA